MFVAEAVKMTLDFNLSLFIEEMKACKPPYRKGS
jgi:hypothetical protein